MMSTDRKPRAPAARSAGTATLRIMSIFDPA